MKLAEATELWLLERTRKLPSVVSVGSSSTSPRVASVTSSAPPLRNSCFSSSAEAAVSSSQRLTRVRKCALSGRDFVRKGFCQEGILSGRNFVREEFCQAGILPGSGLCQEAGSARKELWSLSSFGGNGLKNWKLTDAT